MTLRFPAKAALLCSSLLLVSACAQGASARGMTILPDDVKAPAGPTVASSIGVGKVAGGKETSGLGKPNIDNPPFREALRESLRLAGLLSDRPDAPLSVDATIVQLDTPSFGFDMKARSVVRYVVRETRTGAVVIDEQITAEHTTTIGEAFVGETRIRLAAEGSARKNIALLVQRLNTIRKNTPAAQPPSM